MSKLPDTMEQLWDENAAKYKCCCRSVHVKQATTYIGYAQLFVTMLCVAVLGYYYVQITNGHVSADHWLNHYNTEKYMSSLMLAVLLQLVIVTLMLHGAKMERRSYLLPFIVFATIGVFLGFLQIMYDVTKLLKQARGDMTSDLSPENNQLMSHLIGTMVHTWCVGVVWRLYTFLGDKKIAQQIGAQLATQVAFQYGDIPHGYMGLPDPPPYADTVISDKHPLTLSLA
uniref:Uncharacterized protein n=1 Tax=Plectus sambesii TaxID=2011161 RepID=A0A914WET4_9BILA